MLNDKGQPITIRTKGERDAEKLERATRRLTDANPYKANERDMPKHKTRVRLRPRATATATVDPERLQAYFARTKRDANAQQRYSPVIINHRLCK